MKKILLLMVLISNFSYANYISTMLPAERKNLYVSTVEVANAYHEMGKISKSQSFYRSAVNIYPIGDEVHRLAVKQGIMLDDDKTYSNFIQEGDKAFESEKYKVAIASYLMADELYNSPDLYKKIADTYSKLDQPSKANYYNSLVPENVTIVSEPYEFEELEEFEEIEEELNIILEEDYLSTEN